MITLYVSVTTSVKGWGVVQFIGKSKVTWERIKHVPVDKLAPRDRYAGMNPRGSAEVRVALEEKVSPRNSFSSVAVRVEVSVRCDQNERAIASTRDVLFEEGKKALSHYMSPALQLLQDHVLLSQDD